MRTPDHRRASPGFTLLEIVVALAVTAAALVVLQRATADALRARRALAEHVARRGALRAALMGLTNELSVALPGTLRIVRAQAGASPVLEFAVDEPAPAIVRYRVAAETLERLAVPRFALASGAPDPVALLAGVEALDVRGHGDGGWHDTWDAPALPGLVALDIALASGERAATTVPLLAGGRT